MTKLTSASAALLAIACGVAHAGPPFVTDDPEPVELHHWEINTAATGSWSSDEKSLGLPSVDINYGAAPDLQLHLQPRFTIERDGTTEKGLDDTELGVKYRFYEHKSGDDSFMLSIYPMYQLPTGARRLGADRGTHGVLLPVWAQLDRGPWTIYGGAGRRISHAAGGRDSTFTGITALRKLSGNLELGAEAFHETPTMIEAKSTSGFNVGGMQALSERVKLLFSAGRSRGDESSNLFYVGLQTRF